MQTEVPRAKKGFMCPQFRKDVSKVCHTCAWWTGLTWKDDKTGEAHHKWQCAMVMTALTNVDVVKATNGAQSATESMRNELVIRSGIVPLGHMVVCAPPRDAPQLDDASAEPQKLIEAH